MVCYVGILAYTHIISNILYNRLLPNGGGGGGGGGGWGGKCRRLAKWKRYKGTCGLMYM